MTLALKLTGFMLLCCAAASTPQAPQLLATPPAAEAEKLRTLFCAALAKRDPKARAAFLSFGEKLGRKYEFDGLRDALRSGPYFEKAAAKPQKPDKKAAELHTFGSTTVGYSFSCDAGVFRYAVDCPAAYDPTQPAAVLLDPGHGTGAGKGDEEKAGFLPYYRGQCDQAGLDGYLVVRSEIIEQVGADGQRGELPADQVAAAFQALWRDLASRFCIDPDRLFVSGLSQTGYWSWYLGRASADRYAGIAPMSAVTWQVDPYAVNFMNLPVFVLHGEQDKVCPVQQARGTCDRLQRLGFSVKYLEIPGAGHDVATWSHLHEGLRDFGMHPRKKYAHKVAKAFQTLADPWCAWIRVEELGQLGDGKAQTRPTAELGAEVMGQVVKLNSKGVVRASLFLSRELLDLAQPIEVLWNGKSVYKGKPDRDLGTLLETALDRADWKQTFELALPLRCP